MREFILLASRAKTTADIDLLNLKEAGRIDLVCRAVSSALWTSDHLRTDTIIHIVLNGPSNPPKIISFFGDKLKNVDPDEISIAKFIILALKKGRNLNLNEEIDVSEGIKVSKKSFEKLLKEKSHNQLIYLHEKGNDIRKIKFKEDVVFILGDNLGLPKKTEKFLKNLNAEKISLGKISLFASHCIVIVQNELDRLIL